MEYKTPGCSCKGYTEAVTDARKYREKALRLVCSRIEYFAGYDEPCRRCAVRLSGGDASYSYCDTVIREVDGK